MQEFRFECQKGCTNCCEVEGYVYLTEDDLRNAARHRGMTVRAFEKQYVYRTRHLLRLRKPRASQCHFLIEGGCQLHPDKPTQCRLFPYWPENVETQKGWQRTAKHCPGIGKGPLIQIGEAVETAHEMRIAYPTHYPKQ